MPSCPAAVVIEDLGEHVIVDGGAGLRGLLLHILHRIRQEEILQVCGVDDRRIGVDLAERVQNLLASLFPIVLLHQALLLFHRELRPLAVILHFAKLRNDGAHHGGNLQRSGAETAMEGIAGIVLVGHGGPVDLLSLGFQSLCGLVHRPDKLGHRHLFQLLHIFFLNAQVLQNLQNQLFGGTGGDKVIFHHAGHDNHLVEQALCLGDLSQHGHLHAAAGLAEDGHIVRVSAKAGDVVPHPAESLYQVGHAHVHRVLIFLPKIGKIQIAKGVQAVVHRDHHHVIQLGHIEAVVADLLDGRARGKAAAVNPEQHRLLGAGVAAGGPDVQILAVLGRGPEPVGDHHLSGGPGLIEHRADHTVTARIPHAFPGGDGLGHLKTLGFGVADAKEVVHTVVMEAPQLPLGGGNNGGCLRHGKFVHWNLIPPI